jgi:glycosyltransferase involved in cell wall biosynthesis
MPTVSVIVPNYNHARYLRRRVDSIVEQSYQDFELILLDDSSTDGSRDVLRSYAGHPKVKIDFNEENTGTPFKQWNKGVRMARGRYIWMAESDDYAGPRFLERMVSVLEEHSEATFAYCRSWRVGEDDQILGYADSYLDRFDALHWKSDFVADGPEECRRFFVLCAPVWNASAVLFRKDVYENVGMADERMRISGDYKVWAQMALVGKIGYVSEPLTYYRMHTENVRTRTEVAGLLHAEFFQVMRWVVGRVGAGGALGTQAEPMETQRPMPAELSPPERIEAAKKWLAEAAEWNLRNNAHVSREAMHSYFMDCEFAVIGRGFTISPPTRWQFFLHRLRFYGHYFPGMSWKQRLINLGRIVGAPLVGYRHRHWPEQIYEQLASALESLFKRRDSWQGPSAKV